MAKKYSSNKRKDPIERFKKFIQINESTGCWEFTGAINRGGYGVFRGYDDEWIEGHRFAFKVFVGPLKEGLVICHSCNVRKCCNPKHLRQDTISGNLTDMSYAKTNPTQILSVEEVTEIKKSLKHFYRGQIKDLAHYYKVSKQTISSIKNGTTWSHIQIP
jgi:hypothetical protein